MRLGLAAIAVLAIAVPAAAADKTIAPPTADKTVFVIGVGPPETEIAIAKGEIRADGVFYQATWTRPTIKAQPTDRFVVGEADAGTTQALISATMQYEGTGLFGGTTSQRFVPCGGAGTMSFTATGGKVIYLTDISFDATDEGVKMRYIQNIDGARAFLKAHYPELADRLEAGRYGVVPVNEGRCAR